MPDIHEIPVRLPLFEEAAQVLKEKGIYKRDLTAQELANIMSEIVANLTQGQESVKASVPSMAVDIVKAKGTVAGVVKVEKPIQATIKVSCALDNGTVPDRIKLAGLDIQTEAGFAAKLALKAVNIEGKAREALRDPNQALGSALASQLEPRGVKLTEVGLHFNEQTLSVDLKGGAIQPRR